MSQAQRTAGRYRETVFRLVEQSLLPGSYDIQVVGELDKAVIDELRAAIERAASHDLVLIGLQGCEFIDSSGIATIVQAYNERMANGQRFAVYGATDQVRRVLSLTGLTDNGVTFEDLEAAVTGTHPKGSK
jgi:anti-sigma B factor antagonist